MKKSFSFPLLCAALIIAALMMVVAVRSCSTQHKEARPVSATNQTTTTATQGWPRTLQTPNWPLTLQQVPKRIVSTSVTITRLCPLIT
ncbi:hypothetical protein ACZ87_03876 [Candidatus Erwinia dacicola]|uniref:Uncharacterized protein n=2 Tax=Candidatus Erwinia dacicola TaxID=252393 RepID=A0A328TKL4_9GAMM|nr:hypothetical protein ACZ87_03876 [Candidatus Erwinia dacicola]